MITRIEIDGFKSFLDFKLDVPPFLALVGPNASGKSNLFDALRLVADVVEYGSDQALRSQARGGARNLFHRSTDGGEVDRLTIVVGMVVASPAGPLGMRCRLRLALIGGRPSVEECSASVNTLKTPLVVSPDDTWRMLVNECRSWRTLGLEPAQMRHGAAIPNDEPLDPRGRNLAAVLHRLWMRDVLWQVEVDLAALIPGPSRIAPFSDERRQEYDFDVVFENAGKVPPLLLSDGTLRALALCAAANDADHPGVLLIEEIETGLYPGRLAELLRRIRQRVSDPGTRGEPMRQAIVTSHSPVLVSELYRLCPESLVSMGTAVRVDPDRGRVSGVTLAKPVRVDGEPGTYFSPRQVRKYLSAVRQGKP